MKVNKKDHGAVCNTDPCGSAINYGCEGSVTTTGVYGSAINFAWFGSATNIGNRGTAFSSGHFSSTSTYGENSVAVAIGYACKAKASEGNWIVVVERDTKDNIISIKSGKAGVDIKPDIFYKLVMGKINI